MTVFQKQCLLSYLGYGTGGIDGIWGARSIAATKRFQADYGLEDDGIFGPGTEQRILEVIAGREKPAAPSPERGKPGAFWDETPNFTREEFRCRCGKYCNGFPAEPAERLVRAAQALRDQVGRSMPISSGVRCREHNANVGGVSNSRHLLGHAMDFRVEGMTSAQVLPLAKALPGIVYAYAIDDSFVHMDIGG